MDNINEKEVLEPEKKKKAKFYLPISAIVVYLMVASFLATGVNFSKYISGTNGGDSARVAKFAVKSAQVEGKEIDSVGIYIDSHYYDEREAKYYFTVQNLSDVMIVYKVVVSGVPRGVAVSIDEGKDYGGAKGLVPSSFNSNGVGTLEFGGKYISTMPVGDRNVRSHCLTFWPDNINQIPTSYGQITVSVFASHLD